MPAAALVNVAYIWPTVDSTILTVVAFAGLANKYRIADSVCWSFQIQALVLSLHT